jgi:cephalosporin hydroxylase
MSDFYYDSEAPVQPDQLKAEFTEVLRIFDWYDPQTVVEIGTREGGTLYQWMKHLYFSNTKLNQKLIAVDLPGARWGTRKEVSSSDFYEWADKFFVDFHFVKGDSHNQAIVDRVDELADKGIDWLFIDGDHSLVGIIQDLKNYLPMVNRGGYVVIHDVVPDASDSSIQIHHLFPLLEVLMDDTDIVLSTKDQQSRGLGVIRYYG